MTGTIIRAITTTNDIAPGLRVIPYKASASYASHPKALQCVSPIPARSLTEQHLAQQTSNGSRLRGRPPGLFATTIPCGQG
jgi:hypothetical protein